MTPQTLATRAAALPPFPCAHTRKDLLNLDYRAGALKAALRGLVSPPEGMAHIMFRQASDLLSEIEAADSMALEAA